MQITLNLTEQQAADLEYTATKHGQEGEPYLTARVDDMLTSFSAQRIHDRRAENAALIEQVLNLPEPTRDAVKTYLEGLVAGAQ